MKTNKYIISLVFLGLFFLPLTYQSLHVFFENEHQHIHHYEKCETGEQTIENIDEEFCPICDYEFFTFPLPKIFIHQFKLLAKRNIFYQQKTSFVYPIICTIKTPRAPPFF